eukprot:401604-Amorphochlora_amoeboformis.AAC.2
MLVEPLLQQLSSLAWKPSPASHHTILLLGLRTSDGRSRCVLASVHLVELRGFDVAAQVEAGSGAESATGIADESGAGPLESGYAAGDESRTALDFAATEGPGFGSIAGVTATGDSLGAGR